MRKIILSTVAVALIAASASQAFAAQSQAHARKASQATTSEQFRNARNAVEPTQPAWQYSGWSAPAGR
jgi:CHASE3 domain sensor protein